MRTQPPLIYFIIGNFIHFICSCFQEISYRKYSCVTLQSGQKSIAVHTELLWVSHGKQPPHTVQHRRHVRWFNALWPHIIRGRLDQSQSMPFIVSTIVPFCNFDCVFCRFHMTEWRTVSRYGRNHCAEDQLDSFQWLDQLPFGCHHFVSCRWWDGEIDRATITRRKDWTRHGCIVWPILRNSIW